MLQQPIAVTRASRFTRALFTLVLPPALTLEWCQGLVTRSFGALPRLGDEIPIPHPGLLVARGLWQDLPRGWEAMQAAESYPPGRRVLVHAPVVPEIGIPEYMAHTASEKGERLVTHRAWVVGPTPKGYLVDVEGCNGHMVRIEVSEEALRQLNHGQAFGPPDRQGPPRLAWEDGIVAKYDQDATNAKLVEIASRLAPLIARIDFSGPERECLEAAPPHPCPNRSQPPMLLCTEPDGGRANHPSMP